MNPGRNSRSRSHLKRPSLAVCSYHPSPYASAGPGSVSNPSLLDLLVKKGILTSGEANSLCNTSGTAGMNQLLLLLKAKGVVNDTEAVELKSATEAESMHSLVDTESGPLQAMNLTTGQATQAKPAETGPTVIPAIAPLRVLPIDPPAKEGLVAALKLGQDTLSRLGSRESVLADTDGRCERRKRDASQVVMTTLTFRSSVRRRRRGTRFFRPAVLRAGS